MMRHLINIVEGRLDESVNLQGLLISGLISLLAKQGGSWYETAPSSEGWVAFTGVYPDKRIKVKAELQPSTGYWKVAIVTQPGGNALWDEEGKLNIQPYEATFAAKVGEVINNARRAARA